MDNTDMDNEEVTSWIRGWMLGKYGHFVAPEPDEDWQQ